MRTAHKGDAVGWLAICMPSTKKTATALFHKPKHATALPDRTAAFFPSGAPAADEIRTPISL